MDFEESQFVIKMEIESASSVSSQSSSSSSSKSGLSRNLESFFQPLASSSSLSSSSSSSCRAEIKWVDRSRDPAFDSPIWNLDLFQCSESKINGSYLVKCVVCEQHHTSFIRSHRGTKPFSDHAQSIHPKHPKVEAWLHEKAVQEENAKLKRAEDEGKLKEVVICLYIVLLRYFAFFDCS